VQISQLQSELEETSSKANTNAEQNRVLKRRLEQLSADIERELSKSKDLTDQLSTQEEAYRNELSSRIRLAELWEKSCKETQDRNKDLETQLESEQERSSEETARWQVRVQEVESRALEYEKKIQQLGSEVERLEALAEANAAVPMSPIGLNGKASTPTPSGRAQLSSPSVPSMFSPSAQAIEKRGRTGLSLTHLYTELHNARQAETLQRRRADKLQEEYEQYREEAERWAPEYQHTIQEFERQKEDLAEMSIGLQNAISEKEEAERQLKLMRNGIMDKERETRLYQQRNHLENWTYS
jgi:DNA repair exonuclease SbcCD ATPase subunit